MNESMFFGSLLIGFTMIGFGSWLHFNERRGWDHDDAETELDKQYLSKRMRSRRIVHLLFVACGILVIIAAFAGEGPVWIAAWLSVMVGLFTIMVFAALDAIRTLRYQSKKLPELGQRAKERHQSD